MLLCAAALRWNVRVRLIQRRRKALATHSARLDKYHRGSKSCNFFLISPERHIDFDNSDT
jgi:hypothetical protein